MFLRLQFLILYVLETCWNICVCDYGCAYLKCTKWMHVIVHSGVFLEMCTCLFIFIRGHD